MKKGLLLAIPLLWTGAAQAGTSSYWTDSQGKPVHDSYGNCVKTGTWKAGDTMPGCGEDPAKEELKALSHISMSAGTTFEFDSAALKPEGKRQLDDIARKINRLGDRITAIKIDGHTDNVGAADYNMNLSRERAQSVSEYLKSKGVSGDNIVINAYGATRPVADNSTAEGRMQNRRVDIRVEGK